MTNHKKPILGIIVLVCIVTAAYFWPALSNRTSFEATVLEIHDSYYLVEPIADSMERSSSDRIQVPMQNLDPSKEPQVGDTLAITYNGEIMETYPARLGEVYRIEVARDAEQWVMIPMVMVNGELYLDTGYESSLQARCGVMDGEITSTASGSERPTVNDQSNFGTSYGYQYGTTEGTIELLIDGKWWVYATEAVRRELQFPTDSGADEVLHMGLNAEIIDIDTESMILYVKDIDETAAIFGERCGLVCTDAASRYNLLYVNYSGEDDVRTISFSDFMIGDSVIVTLSDSDKESALNGVVFPYQVQLGTQRMS